MRGARLCVLWWLHIAESRWTECSEMSRTEEGDALRWGGGGSRWEREREREGEREGGGNKGIDSSPSYPYCLWAHVGWTCWTPTERPAVTEKNRGKPWWGIFRQTGTDSLLFSDSACFASGVSMYRGVSETDHYSLGAHTHMLDTLTQIMIHSVARKHLWPRYLRSSLGISWGWVRKERLLLLLSDPPLTSFQHSSCKSFLSYFSFFTTPQRFSFVSNLHLSAHFLFSARAKRGQLFPNSPVPSVPSYSPCTLTHNNKIPSAAISHQLHARGVASQRWLWNTVRHTVSCCWRRCLSITPTLDGISASEL